MPEVLGDTGMLFDPRDHQDMAAKIEALLSDEKLGKELGAKAAIRGKLFVWKNTASETATVLKNAAGRWFEITRPVR